MPLPLAKFPWEDLTAGTTSRGRTVPSLVQWRSISCRNARFLVLCAKKIWADRPSQHWHSNGTLGAVSSLDNRLPYESPSTAEMLPTAIMRIHPGLPKSRSKVNTPAENPLGRTLSTYASTRASIVSGSSDLIDIRSTGQRRPVELSISSGWAAPSNLGPGS